MELLLDVVELTTAAEMFEVLAVLDVVAYVLLLLWLTLSLLLLL